MGRSRNTFQKRQRELKKAEKAAIKRGKRHGTTVGGFTEPQATVRLGPPKTDADAKGPDDQEQ